MYLPATPYSATSVGQKYRFFSIIMKINLPFINWSQINNDKRLVLSVVVFTLSNLLVSSGAHLIYRVLFFILALLIIKAMKSLTLRFILAFFVHITDSGRYQYQFVFMVYIRYNI